jgi:hypothetical protein
MAVAVTVYARCHDVTRFIATTLTAGREVFGCALELESLARCKVKKPGKLLWAIAPHRQAAVVAAALLENESVSAMARIRFAHKCLNGLGLNPNRSQGRHSGTLR